VTGYGLDYRSLTPSRGVDIAESEKKVATVRTTCPLLKREREKRKWGE
jgi:hypothetical protein